uniref:Reverse transcriptase domain-containing protein n=1 Tax=Lactuca sativa TaxID=4236 RepID=A0A9R1UZG0_LACSA|nr:hypothetical protein LSAT_V11C700364930 [Lactuca sativa]
MYIQMFKISHNEKLYIPYFLCRRRLFVGEWSESNIKNLARILLSSGLKVNFHKSKVLGIGASMNKTNRWASLLRCESTTLQFTFLGVPVGANMNLKKNWKPIIERFQSKLSSWKSKTLSFRERLTIVKSIFGNLPTYFFSLFIALVGVINTLERFQRQFLWCWVDNKTKMNLDII